jgi:hypothetical protein
LGGFAIVEILWSTVFSLVVVNIFYGIICWHAKPTSPTRVPPESRVASREYFMKHKVHGKTRCFRVNLEFTCMWYVLPIRQSKQLIADLVIWTIFGAGRFCQIKKGYRKLLKSTVKIVLHAFIENVFFMSSIGILKTDKTSPKSRGRFVRLVEKSGRDCLSPRGRIVLGTLCPGNASSRGRFVQGTFRLGMHRPGTDRPGII